VQASRIGLSKDWHSSVRLWGSHRIRPALAIFPPTTSASPLWHNLIEATSNFAETFGGCAWIAGARSTLNTRGTVTAAAGTDFLAAARSNFLSFRREFFTYFSAMIAAPAAINNPPRPTLQVIFSPRNTAAKTITSTTLSLSIGATRDASPSWRARK
jgi:hypothetical protein